MASNPVKAVDLKLEVVVIPVADVERSKKFYTGLGWRLDADFSSSKDTRIVQVTPPGSPCSVIFGSGQAVPMATPGSAQRLYLVVSDIEKARAEIVGRGVGVSEPFHLGDNWERVAGSDPQRRSYSTYASFTDPDGNGWLLQEIKQRLPGRVDAPSFASAGELASALRRAEIAHGVYEARLGKKDGSWSVWYADYILREQAGEASQKKGVA